MRVTLRVDRGDGGKDQQAEWVCVLEVTPAGYWVKGKNRLSHGLNISVQGSAVH